MAIAVVAGSSVTARAELIPAARLVDWTPGVNVGVPGGVDQYLTGGAKQRTNVIDVTKSPYSADNTGKTDVTPIIQKALDAAPANSVVYLPAGTYRCDATLYIGYTKDSITLRGDGAKTVIDTRAGEGIHVGVGSDYMWQYPTDNNTITGGLTKGSSTVTIADTSVFFVGGIIQFKFQNDSSIPVLGVGGGDNFRHQTCVVTGKTATTLSFTPALYETYGNSSLVAKVNYAQLQSDFVGIEDLTLDCTNGGATFGVWFEQCYGSWAKNVRVTKPANYAFFLFNSVKCELRQCYADQRQSQGTNGAGLLCNQTSACLVEDNIFYKFFPLMEINQGSSGNVFGYNFCYDSDVYGTMGCAINSNHGPHNSYNLYEGNVSPNLQCDGYFGGASRDTVFRNWFHGTSPAITNGWSITLNRFTREYSLVGNILGTSTNTGVTYSFGNPNMGNTSYSGTAQPSLGRWWADWGKTPGPSGFQEKDLDVEATTTLKGNYLYGTGIPAAEALGTDVLPTSLYRTTKPTWFGSFVWPAIDPSNPNPTFAAIPAGYRYVNGSGVATVQPPTADQVPIAVTVRVQTP